MASAGPVWLTDVDAGGCSPIPPRRALDGRPYATAAVAVRVHGFLVGVAELPLPDALEPPGLAERATEALRAQIEMHLRAGGCELHGEGTPACREEHGRFLERAPFASIVIASRDGERTLPACLDSLLRLDYPSYEVIVVDSASRGRQVERLVRETYGGLVRYVREDLPGLALAHNRGLEEASGSIVAFTDDDVVADPAWLAQIAKAFEAAPDVGCVTGLILPAELESSAQVWLDGYWGLGKGFERRVFDYRRTPREPLYPYAAGVFGSGANMAFRADALRAMGGFDPALGAGSTALGGDDLAAFFDVIEAGHALVYEPTAFVRHRHRPDYDSLRRQAYGYGAGLTAYLAKTVADDPRRLVEITRRLPGAVAHVLAPGSAKNERMPSDFPRELVRIERRGMLAGGLAYARSRRRIKALAGSGA